MGLKLDGSQLIWRHHHHLLEKKPLLMAALPTLAYLAQWRLIWAQQQSLSLTRKAQIGLHQRFFQKVPKMGDPQKFFLQTFSPHCTIFFCSGELIFCRVCARMCEHGPDTIKNQQPFSTHQVTLKSHATMVSLSNYLIYSIALGFLSFIGFGPCFCCWWF